MELNSEAWNAILICILDYKSKKLIEAVVGTMETKVKYKAASLTTDIFVLQSHSNTGPIVRRRHR